VAADEIGEAATLAVETASRAGVEGGVGAELFDLTVSPYDAVADHYGDQYPQRSD
jgi:hypothetical protein